MAPSHLRIVPSTNIETANESSFTIPGVSESRTSIGTLRATSVGSRVEVSEPETRGQSPGDTELEQLYPASAELDTRLSQALILLSQALQRLDRAIEYIRARDAILADDQVHHLLVLLDELFCLRNLSEGFASVVNACGNGIRNLHGQIIEEAHLLALNSCLLALKKKPFISFDASLESIERLEAAGLDGDTVGIEYLVDWLNDEGAN